ncbi:MULTISPECIES: ribosomal protein S18-alanine N-acetyltransferase [Vibrio]|uniref:[Ribosomal protein bS18]-alanine N-acetyltransferase n=1 Tax=Vibrio aestuarianus TaxID=28171 RepID=A0A9X4IPM3_9VIBR|nr:MULTISPECIES: ribosomal protein S18-alanine N-acetyltransferase [Vibrio]KOE81125.1 alanine acetyltransferase [Vibrio alginolyticus]MBD1564281.1 ribosomal protein S18-alanine N-acetyltransferase [Vibrio sp. S12_S33]MDE1209967.1 ribosomal protein S18-alanine N-acetyltransferase [Vibrio aestuarianus]MDE1212140.1 ribosomal protein S18-alanine N-acetyltransferase [Vibrio aestuarianus]MDE1217699.1 ribosomal protein S18-alanine N-acetyltransferase [Vibrio aestuarianus]
MNIDIVPLSLPYLDAVWCIEQQAHSHPWAESLVRDLNNRGACHYVMLKNEEVVGYFYAQNIIGEVTLLNIAVDPKWQGKGYGKMLTEFFLAMCEKAKAESAWLEVRESNVRAYSLYESLGFNELDRRVNYYPTDKGSEDAIIMSYYFL